MQRCVNMYEGLRRLARGDWQGAREAWQAAVRADPHNARVRTLLSSMDTLMPMRSAVTTITENEPWAGSSQTPPVELQTDGPGMTVFISPNSTAPVEVPSLSAQHLLTMQGRLHDLLALHDFSGALDVAEKLLKAAPGYAPALRARHLCRDALQQMYESRLGSIKRIPRVLVRPEEVPWLDLDPRAGFVLSQVDGVSSYEEIRDVSGLDGLEALRVLTKLVTDKVIGA